MDTLVDLANQMEGLSDRIQVFAKRTTDEVALTILNDLLQTTPVDVGTALSNWQLTLETPASGILSAFVPSPKGKVVKGTWKHLVDPILTAQNNLPQLIAEANAILAARLPGQIIFITNNLPYIQRLNEGSSDQAPAGFVDRAIILGGQIVERAKL